MTALFPRLAKHGSQPSGKKTKPVHLLIELRAFDKGGLEQVVLNTACHLNPDLFRVVVVSMNCPGYLAKLAMEAGIKVYDVSGIRCRQRYRSILRKEDINLSNSHFSGYGYRLFEEHGIPNITFIHNVYAFLDSRALREMRDNDRYVKTYISVSPNATRYATQKIGLSESKFITIANGLSIEAHQERLRRLKPFPRHQLGIDANDYVFLNVASYNLHKGHYLMAEAMQKVLRIRSDIRIVCIGNVVHPPHLTAFKAHLQQHGLDRHLLLPGHFPDVQAFYTMADAFLLPSFVEGWSIAMNEAMFYERPMILTDTGAAAEVISNGDIGRIIPNEYGDILNLDCERLDAMAYHQRQFKTSDALVEAMLDFADNREHWREAGKLGRDKLAADYAFSHIVRQYEDVFLKVARRR